jgi:magnesium chelatase family protein
VRIDVIAVHAHVDGVFSSSTSRGCTEMGQARTVSISLTGLEGTLVEVEADVSPGLPAFSLVGLPDSSTLQARERVRAASARSGVHLAQRRITVNMTPVRWR